MAAHVVEYVAQSAGRAAAEGGVADDGEAEAGAGESHVDAPPVRLAEETEFGAGIASGDGEDREVAFAALNGVDGEDFGREVFEFG